MAPAVRMNGTSVFIPSSFFVKWFTIHSADFDGLGGGSVDETGKSTKNNPRAIGPLRVVSLSKTFQDVDRGFLAPIVVTFRSDIGLFIVIAFDMMRLQFGLINVN